MKKVITYDLPLASDMEFIEMNEFLEELNAKVLNEFAFLIDTDLSDEAIINRIKEIVNYVARVYLITVGNDGQLSCEKIELESRYKPN